MIDITTPATWLGSVQFVQSGISLVQDQDYTLGFWAKASVDRPIGIVLRMSSGPWTQYNNLNQDITTSWQWYELPFTAGGTDPNATLQLSLGQFASTVWVDGVVLAQGQIGPTSSRQVQTGLVFHLITLVSGTIILATIGVRSHL
jgi:hypothetical protein